MRPHRLVTESSVIDIASLPYACLEQYFDLPRVISPIKTSALLEHHRHCDAHHLATIYSFQGRPWPGKWSIPDRKWPILLYALASDHDAHRKHFLVEVRSPISALALIDLFTPLEGGVCLAHVIQRVTERCFPSKQPLLAFITSSNGTKPNGEQVSSYHFHWPFINADNQTQIQFATAVQHECITHISNGDNSWHGKLWSQIIDTSIYVPGKGLRMLWCDKQEFTSDKKQLIPHNRPKLPYAIIVGHQDMKRLRLPENSRERWLFGVATSIRRGEGFNPTPTTLVPPAAAAIQMTLSLPPQALTLPKLPPLPRRIVSIHSEALYELGNTCLEMVRRSGNPNAQLASTPRLQGGGVYVPFKFAHNCGFRDRPHRSNGIYVLVNLYSATVRLRCFDKESCAGRHRLIGHLPHSLVLPLRGATLTGQEKNK